MKTFQKLKIPVLCILIMAPMFAVSKPHVENEISLLEAIESISREFNVYFTFDVSLVEKIRVEYEENNFSNAESAIRNVLEGTGLHFKFYEERFIIIYKNDVNGLQSLKKMAKHIDGLIIDGEKKQQQRKNLAPTRLLSHHSKIHLKNNLIQDVAGQVLNASGEPLVGVNVVVKGSGTGTATDLEGRFYLTNVDKNATIEFSYVGYRTMEIQLNGNSEISVILIEDSATLDEVVVVGYGTQKKSDITGSVSSLDASDFESEVITSVNQGLQGKIAGVQITSSGGAPGGNMLVRIRGNNSILGSNDPLYVLDGFPIDAGNNGSTSLLSTLNPSDIQSIEVLKDASATAIYGSRGSNGVVLITTKRGQKGKNIISFETSVGSREITKTLDMMDSRQFVEIANERNENDGVPILFTNIDSLSQINTNWQDEVFRSGIVQNHSLQFSGGNENTQYLISGNYLNEEGIIINSGFQRGALRINLDQKIKDNFNVSGKVYLSKSVNNEVNDDLILSSILNSPPLHAVRNPDGSYVTAATLKQYPFSPSNGDNPVAVANEQVHFRTFNKAIASLSATYEIIKDLKFNVLVGADVLDTKVDFYNPRTIEAGLPAGEGSKSYSNRYSYLNENTLSYDRALRQNDFLNVVIGYTWQNAVSESLSGSSRDFVNDDLLNNNLATGENFGPPSTGYTDWTLISWLGRVNYNLNNTYLFTFSGRADGSSRFGAGNKWGFFPSGAFAWRIYQEDFMKNKSNQLSDLKLRLSYGISGNQAINPYQSLQQFSRAGLAFGGSPTTGFAAVNLGNPELKWETTEEFNAGLEFGFWNNRLYVQTDFYVKNTRDLLALVNVPPTSGFTTNIYNIGSTRNSGIEVMLDYQLLNKNHLQWNISLNASKNTNEVTKTAGGQDIIASAPDILGSANIVREGEPLGAYYGLVTDGLTENGLYNFVDQDGDGNITNNDRMILGSPYPDLVGGISSDITYKQFSLRITAQGQLGKTLWNNNKYRHMNSFHRGSNQVADVATNRWTHENPNPNAPYPKATNALNQAPSDWFLEDASYVRIQNIRLSYKLAPLAVQNSAFENLMIYFSAQNPFTFTKYSWYTPDINSFGSGDLRIGIDQRTYPAAKTFMLGLSFQL